MMVMMMVVGHDVYGDCLGWDKWVGEEGGKGCCGVKKVCDIYTHEDSTMKLTKHSLKRGRERRERGK
jgi:hypothetical protein